MLYRQLGKSDLQVSVVGLGTMSWPGSHFGEEDHSMSAEDFSRVDGMVRAARDQGINLLDTAEAYGRGWAEELVGRTLEDQGCRNEMIITTKVGPLFDDEQIQERNCNLSAAHVLQRCEASLQRLRTDRIDLYLAHWPDAFTPIEETMEAMEKLREQGKIRWFGVSNFTNDMLSAALDVGPVVANQICYSLVDRDIDADKRPFCEKNNVGIMAYSPLGKGVLSGKYTESSLPSEDDYRHQRFHFAPENLDRHFTIAKALREIAPQLSCTPAQLALAWVIARPGVTLVLPGAKSPAQVVGNAGAGDLIIPESVLAKLDQISKN